MEEAQRALEETELDLDELEEDASEIESELAELDIDPAREIYLSKELKMIEHQIAEKQGELEICQDDIETIEEEQEHIKAQLKGFKLAIDFQKLNYTDKLYAREMLEKAMSQLEVNEEDQ